MSELPTRATQDEVNQQAQFLPARDANELPAIRVGGALVLAYWMDGRLCITADTEDLTSRVPIRFAINGHYVWSCTDY